MDLLVIASAIETSEFPVVSAVRRFVLREGRLLTR